MDRDPESTSGGQCRQCRHPCTTGGRGGSPGGRILPDDVTGSPSATWDRAARRADAGRRLRMRDVRIPAHFRWPREPRRHLGLVDPATNQYRQSGPLLRCPGQWLFTVAFCDSCSQAAMCLCPSVHPSICGRTITTSWKWDFSAAQAILGNFENFQNLFLLLVAPCCLQGATLLVTLRCGPVVCLSVRGRTPTHSIPPTSAVKAKKWMKLPHGESPIMDFRPPKGGSLPHSVTSRHTTFLQTHQG